MKYIIGIIVVIAILAWILNRRGSGGLGGGTETTDKALGQSHREGPGAGQGFGGGS